MGKTRDRLKAALAEREAAKADTKADTPTQATTPDNTPLELGQTIKDEPRAKAKARATSGTKTATDADEELARMQAEAPLYDLICRDTGESPSIGATTYFHSCPICGHHNCFRYYPQTNSWACFGGSNENQNSDGREGGGYIKYLLRTGHASNNTEAVRMLREATGHRYEGKSNADNGTPNVGKPGASADNGGGTGTDSNGAGASGSDARPKVDNLPPWGPCRSHDPRKELPALIHDVLRRRAIGIIAAKGKASKTWLMLRLGIEVTQGGEFLGHQLERGRVLFIDAEMGEAAIDNRVKLICDALGYDRASVDERLIVWSVEGVTVRDGDTEHAPTIDDLLQSLGARGETFDLIIMDSCANFLQRDADENSNSDVTTFFGKLRKANAITGAAIWLSHHFGKGAQGDRDGADMLRGASAWLDRPSVAFVMREVLPPSGKPSDYLSEGQRAFSIECVGMRSFAWPEEAHVIWGFPLHVTDEDGTTDGWKPKESGRRNNDGNGNVMTAEAATRRATALAALYAEMYHGEGYEDGIPGTEAVKVVSEALGKKVQGRTVKEYVESQEGAYDFGLSIYQKSARKWYVVADHAPHARAQDGEAQADTGADTIT